MRKRLRRMRVLVLLVFASTFWAVGCSKNPISGRKQLIAISRQQEIQMGQEAAPEFEKEFGGKVPDEQLQQYVQSIGDRLAAVSDRQDVPYTFGLLASDVPNAFALPGGPVYVTAGLMQIMDSERELAAVLGHEITHIVAQHSVEHMQQQMGAAVLVELAGMAAGPDKQEAAKAAAQVAAGMAVLRYSRRDEYEADRGGIKYLAAAGYNPWGMVELLEHLQQLHDGPEGGMLEEMFMTHPLTSERIKEARQYIEQDYSSASKAQPDPNRDRFLQMRAKLPPYIVRQQSQ